MAAEWSSLPCELICLIADGFSTIEDLFALTSVCRSFRYAVDTKRWRPKVASRSPWLLLCCQDDAEDNDNDEIGSQRGLLSIYKNKKLYMNLPELHGRHCWGSSYGWIVTLGLDLQLHLFNPLSRRRILLPPLTYQQEWDERSLLSWDDENEKAKCIRRMYIDVRALLIKRPPSSYSSSNFDDFLVITTGPLSEPRVVRPHTWACVKFPSGDWPGFVYDIACHNGQIYMLGNRGILFLCSNFDGPDPPKVEKYLTFDESLDSGEKYYLVESLGDLLMVVRYVDDIYIRSSDQPRHKTYAFIVFKLDHKKKKWVELEDLGDRALFVGDCQSLALCRPEDFNCQRNCIYFADDLYEKFYVVHLSDDGKRELVDVKGGRDMGIYDYEDETIQPLYEGTDSLSFYSTPNWFIPAFT